MKSKQVGYVLIALIVIGVAGILLRLIAAGSSELMLEGILPISPDVIDKVTISSSQSETTLLRSGDTWQVGRSPAFQAKLAALWAAVEDIDGAQLIAVNPENHGRMGVREGQGILVSFWLGTFKQEEFIVGKWSDNVRLCYLKKPSKNEVYGIPCPLANLFDADPNGWRDPIIFSMPNQLIESIEYEYADETFSVNRLDKGWIIQGISESEPANIFAVNAVLSSLEILISQGFATAEETSNLDFNGPNAISLRIIPKEDSGYPVSRVRLLPRDESTFYAKTPLHGHIFILSTNVTNTLLLKSSDFIAPEQNN